MAYAVQWIRSLLFNFQMYVAMVIVAIVFLIPMIFSQNGASLAAKVYCWWVVWSARLMIGLRVPVRGTLPYGDVLVAAKHPSFFVLTVIFHCLDR